MLNKILPLGTVINYKMPKCPCDGGGWLYYSSEIVEFHRDKLTFYRTQLGHIVMLQWVESYDQN